MKETPLIEICDIHARIGWQGLRSDEFLSYGPYYLITGTDIKDGFIDWNNAYFINRERYCQDTHIQLRVGDILITKDGTIGKVGYVNYLPKEATLNSGVYVIRPKKESLIYPNFLSWFFKSLYFDSFIQELKAGSTISHLYQKDFVKLTVLYPENIEEQKRIAGALSDIDFLIREIDVLIEKKRSILQGTMQELLTAKRRLSGFSEPWHEKFIDEICKITTGESNTQDQDQSGIYPFYIRSSSVMRSNRYLFDCEGIITIGDGQIGKVFHYTNGKFDLHQRCYLLYDFEEVYVKFFFYYFSFFFYNRVISLSAKATVDSVRRNMIAKMKVEIPKAIAEQKAIAEILSDMESEISELETKRDKYIAIRQGMMQQLLTGKIRLI